MKAIADAALPLAGAGAAASVGTGSKATKVMNTAAIGKAIWSELSAVTEEDCLVACSTYITGCTHVTTGALPFVFWFWFVAPLPAVRVQGPDDTV
ncbi:MAG: hypothetical protein HC767_10230 [Akkermansiaceae bacterium]|nr:hypothetical protein [Akkermansiaceae bacterium]